MKGQGDPEMSEAFVGLRVSRDSYDRPVGRLSLFLHYNLSWLNNFDILVTLVQG